MKTATFHCLTMLLLVCAFGGAERALAFHSGGVGDCEGCHSIHNYQDGMPSGTANPYLLRGTDASSTCLTCHQQVNDIGPTTYHVSTPAGETPAGVPPKQLSPAGDFGWLKKSYSWVAATGAPFSYSYGDRHGHNIIAADFGYGDDGQNAVAPGGTYPAAALSCTSCHDPHGKYRRTIDGSIRTDGAPIKSSGSFLTSPVPSVSAAVGAYRLLAGTGYAPKSVIAGLAFIYGPPAAVAPFPANRAENNSVTRVAYGAGMSDWCRNCHGNIHTGSSAFLHPTQAGLGLTISLYYNQYVRSGDLTGTVATAYSSLAPFEVGTANYDILRSIAINTPTKGPDNADGSAAVMCLSCHRAHASGWDGMMRWNPKTEFIVFNGKYSQDSEVYQPYGQGRTEAEALQAYYQTPAASFSTTESPSQPRLCYKCHVVLP